MSLRIALASMALGLALVACRGGGEPRPLPPELAREVAQLRESNYFGLANFIETVSGAGLKLDYLDQDAHVTAYACDDLWSVGFPVTLTRADGISSDVTLIEYLSLADIEKVWMINDRQLELIPRSSCIGSRRLDLFFGSAVRHEGLVLMFHDPDRQEGPRSDDFDAALAALLATVETDR